MVFKKRNRVGRKGLKPWNKGQKLDMVSQKIPTNYYRLSKEDHDLTVTTNNQGNITDPEVVPEKSVFLLRPKTKEELPFRTSRNDHIHLPIPKLIFSACK